MIRLEAGKADWVDVLGKFYTGFDKMLTKAEKDMEGKRVKIPDEPTDIVCDKCGKPMVIKIGPYGKFLGCSGSAGVQEYKENSKRNRRTLPALRRQDACEEVKEG